MRTFIGLCFSVGMTRRIAESMEREAGKLAETGAKLAWVTPAMMHVTLKYFGEIPEESLDAIAARLRLRCVDLSPISLQAKSYGVFPLPSEAGGQPPRVLWVGVEGGKPLAALQQAVETDMEDLGFGREPRKYQPHLTVARVLEAPAAASIVWKSEVDFGMEKIGELVIFESQNLNRGGVEYLPRARVPFTKH